jgi:UDP-N-acetylmuramoyl-tripeptide--D-alanyl-D-alanine ligase
MMAALESFRQAGAEAKVVILGDMLELGAEREKEHRAIVEQLQAMNFEQVILVGPEFVKAARDTGFLAFDKNTEALEYLKEHPIKDRLILLKGSRGIAVEILLEAL